MKSSFNRGKGFEPIDLDNTITNSEHLRVFENFYDRPQPLVLLSVLNQLNLAKVLE